MHTYLCAFTSTKCMQVTDLAVARLHPLAAVQLLRAGLLVCHASCRPYTVEVYGLIHMNSCIGRLCGMSRVVPPLHCRGVWLQPIHYVQVYGLICMISCIGRFYGMSRVVQPIHLCKCMQYVHECVHRCVHEYVCVCMHVNMNMCIQKQSLMPMHIHVYIYLSAITTPTDKTRAGQGAQGQPARRNGRIYIHIYIDLYISIHIHTYIGQRRSFRSSRAASSKKWSLPTCQIPGVSGP